MCLRSWPMSISATELPSEPLFFDPGGRPRRFAFLAMKNLPYKQGSYKPAMLALPWRSDSPVDCHHPAVMIVVSEPENGS